MTILFWDVRGTLMEIRYAIYRFLAYRWENKIVRGTGIQEIPQ